MKPGGFKAHIPCTTFEPHLEQDMRGWLILRKEPSEGVVSGHRDGNLRLPASWPNLPLASSKLSSDPGTAKNHTLFTKVFLQCTVWSTKQKRAGGSQECSLQQVTATFSWGRKKRRPCPFELGPFAFAGRFIALAKESQA